MAATTRSKATAKARTKSTEWPRDTSKQGKKHAARAASDRQTRSSTASKNKTRGLRARHQRKATIRSREDSNEDGASEDCEEDGPSGPTQPRYKIEPRDRPFSGSVEDNKGFINAVPVELMHEIFSYLVMDHDPDFAIKECGQDDSLKSRPHVLLSMAAMSRRFAALVESFSERNLTQHKKFYRFQTDAEKAQEVESKRVSPRYLSARTRTQRVYRLELLNAIQCRCFECGRDFTLRAAMCNGVAAHASCELRMFGLSKQRTGNEAAGFRGEQMTLTDALSQFDLRDYMLIKARKPGPRAKHTDLPTITHGTVMGGMGYGVGGSVSYRFFVEDVRRIAQLVHGDVRAHMGKKFHEQWVRRHTKMKRVWIELKTRYHNDGLARAKDGKDDTRRLFHMKGLAKVKRRAEQDDSTCFIESMYDYTYGEYDDVGDRISAVEPHCLCGGHCR